MHWHICLFSRSTEYNFCEIKEVGAKKRDEKMKWRKSSDDNERFNLLLFIAKELCALWLLFVYFHPLIICCSFLLVYSILVQLNSTVFISWYWRTLTSNTRIINQHQTMHTMQTDNFSLYSLFFQPKKYVINVALAYEFFAWVCDCLFTFVCERDCVCSEPINFNVSICLGLMNFN